MSKNDWIFLSSVAAFCVLWLVFDVALIAKKRYRRGGGTVVLAIFSFLSFLICSLVGAIVCLINYGHLSELLSEIPFMSYVSDVLRLCSEYVPVAFPIGIGLLLAAAFLSLLCFILSLAKSYRVRKKKSAAEPAPLEGGTEEIPEENPDESAEPAAEQITAEETEEEITEEESSDGQAFEETPVEEQTEGEIHIDEQTPADEEYIPEEETIPVEGESIVAEEEPVFEEAEEPVPEEEYIAAEESVPVAEEPIVTEEEPAPTEEKPVAAEEKPAAAKEEAPQREGRPRYKSLYADAVIPVRTITVRPRNRADEEEKPKPAAQKSAKAAQPKQAANVGSPKKGGRGGKKSGSTAAQKPIEQKPAEPIVEKQAVEPSPLPVTRRLIIMNRHSAVNMFSEYLAAKKKEDAEKLENSINTIVFK